MEKISYKTLTFEIDKEKTLNLSEAIPACACPACENFRKSVKNNFSEMCAFLTDIIGIDPDSAASNECYTLDDGRIEYSPRYCIIGKVIDGSDERLQLGSCLLTIEKTGGILKEATTDESFVIAISGVVLPYTLDVPLYFEQKKPIVKRGPLKNFFDRLFNWVFKK
ncbi:MAG: hypothetical protein IJT70_02655 [Clostridia bacterium]|nr:hypothetical protein [Clostridia bacterium]